MTLLLDAEGTGGTEARRPARQPPGEIFDYFAEEMYSRLGKEMKSFLLRSAFLPRMTVGMAQRLTGNPRAGRILSYLSTQNYFTETHPAPEPVYQYHALFREFLLQRAQSAFPGTEGQGIRREVASILLEEGQAEDAAEHLRMAGDWSGLVRVILREAPSLIATRPEPGALGLDPASAREEYSGHTPWLSYWLGVAILPFEPSNARRLFEEALARFRQEGDAAGAFLSWSGIGPAVWFEKVGYEYYDSFLSTLDDLLQEFGGFPSPEIEARTLCGMFQALTNWLPIGVDGNAWIARGRAVVDGISDTSLKGALLANMFSYSMIRRANAGQVDSLFASIEPLLRKKDLPPILRIEMSLYAAHNFQWIAEYDRCLEVVAEGLKSAEAAGLHILDMFLLGHATLAALHKGDEHAVKSNFRRMAALLPKATPHDAGFYYFISSLEALEKGDSALAEQHWKVSMELTLKTGFPGAIHMAWIVGALVKRALGKPGEARAILSEARKIESRHQCDKFSYQTELIESILLIEDGNVPGGVETLREAMQRGRERGLLGSHFWHPTFFAKIAARALREGIEVPYVQEMIRKNRLLPGPGRPGPGGVALAGADLHARPVRTWSSRGSPLRPAGRPRRSRCSCSRR